MRTLMMLLLDRRNRVAWLVLAVCLVLTWLVWSGLREQSRVLSTQQFNLHVRAVEEAIKDRMRQHEQILLGGAGLFDASDTVTRADWHAYVTRLQLAKNYTGIQGVGFSQLIAPAALQAHIATIQGQGFPKYTVHPPGERPLYTSIIYLEPFSERNLAAFGFDMMSEATRAKAMRLAAETGKTTITGKVKLVQENQGKVQAGFLMYVPIYDQHLPVDTLAQRWHALQGFVYSPYRVNDLMRGILGVLGESLDVLDFMIFDGAQESDATRMYDSSEEQKPDLRKGSPLLSTVRTIQGFEQTWTVRLQSRSGFEASFDSWLNIIVPVLSASISVLLFFLLSFLRARRENAHDMAKQISVYAAIIASSSDAIMSKTLDGIVTSWNLAAEKMFAYTEQEMIGQPMTKLMPVEQQDEESAILAKIKNCETFQPFETIRKRKNGQIFPISVNISPIKNAMGISIGASVIARDITDRINEERITQERAQQTQAILDHVIDGIITIDGAGTVQSMNRAAQTIFGYAAFDVIGRNVNMLMPEPYHSQHDGYLSNYRNTGVPRIIGTGREVQGRRQDGSTFPMDLAVSQSTQQGQLLFIGLVRDITERKRVDQMKTEFVSTVSHELRTPLTSISGALGLIVGGALGEVSSLVKPMLDIAHKNSLRLSHLINDLLDMEKLAVGKIRFDFQVQLLMPLVEQALESTRSYGEQYQVSFVITERSDEAQVRVDGSRLLQVLSNFLSNAAKFSPPASRVEVSVRQHQGSVRVAVIDHGAGIADDFRSQIFQQFSQADSSDTRQKGGTGLGLAISKELIERMNGMIGFESEQGHGAQFHFELPLWQAPAAALPQAVVDDNHGVRRLLVVEDDPDIAQLLSLLLTRAGYQVDVALDGETALNFLAHGRYAAMTLDLMLPDHSGVMLIRQIRAQAETELLPIIVVSAYSDDGKLAVNGDFAAIDWLDKPIDEARLTSAIRRSLTGASSHKPRVLYVEDDDDDLHHIVAAIGRDIADFEVARSLAQARTMLALETYSLVILDIGLPDGSGWDLLPQLRALDPAPPVIVLSGAEPTQAQQALVQQALLKSLTVNLDLLTTLKRLIAAQPITSGDATP